MASAVETNSADKESQADKVSLSNFKFIRKIPNPIQTTFLFGKLRSFSRLSVLEWVYIVTSVIAVAASAGLTLQRIFTTPVNSSDFTFAVLLIVAIAFSFYYVVHSVFTERGDELLVFLLTTGIVAIYCILNYVQLVPDTVKLVRLIVVCVMSPFVIIVGILLTVNYCRSNRLKHDIVGAYKHLQDSVFWYFVCSSLLKFDLQLQVSMVVLVMGPHGNDMNLEQKIILGSGLILTVVFIVVGFSGLIRESKAFMVAFYVLGLLEPGYVIYKFYAVAKYETIRSATYVSSFLCGALALTVWIALMVCSGYFIARHFGKGLKEILHGIQSGHETEVREVQDVPLNQPC